MANICSTTACFISRNRFELEELRKRITKRMNEENRTVMALHDEMGLPQLKHEDPRCWIEYCDVELLPSGNSGEYSFSVDTESAWGPNLEPFFAIVRSYEGRMRMLYMSEEPGCEIYVTNDIKREHFQEQCDVDFDYKDDCDHVYLDTMDDVFHFLNKELKLNIEKTDELMKPEKLSKKVEEELEKAGLWEDGNSYFNIHEYEYDKESNVNEYHNLDLEEEEKPDFEKSVGTGRRKFYLVKEIETPTKHNPDQNTSHTYFVDSYFIRWNVNNIETVQEWEGLTTIDRLFHRREAALQFIANEEERNTEDLKDPNNNWERHYELMEVVRECNVQKDKKERITVINNMER